MLSKKGDRKTKFLYKWVLKVSQGHTVNIFVKETSKSVTVLKSVREYYKKYKDKKNSENDNKITNTGEV